MPTYADLDAAARALVDAFRFHTHPITPHEQALIGRFAARVDLRVLIELVQLRTAPPAPEAQIRALSVPLVDPLVERLAASLETARAIERTNAALQAALNLPTALYQYGSRLPRRERRRRNR